MKRTKKYIVLTKQELIHAINFELHNVGLAPICFGEWAYEFLEKKLTQKTYRLYLEVFDKNHRAIIPYMFGSKCRMQLEETKTFLRDMLDSIGWDYIDFSVEEIEDENHKES